MPGEWAEDIALGYPKRAGLPPRHAATYSRAVPAPSKSLAVAGGVLSIVLSSLYTLIALIGILGASTRGADTGAVVVGIIMLALGLCGIAFGVVAVRATPWGSLADGILHTVITVFYGLAIIGIELDKAKLREKPWLTGNKLEEKIHQLDIVVIVCAVVGVISLATAVLGYLGYGNAKRWQAASVSRNVADVF